MNADIADHRDDPIIYCNPGEHRISIKACWARQQAKRDKTKSLAKLYCRKSCERFELEAE